LRDDPKQPPARAHVRRSGRAGRPTLPDEQRQGGEREIGVGYGSKERNGGRKGAHVRAKDDHFRSKMSLDRSIVIGFASKGSPSREKGIHFLSKLRPLRDIHDHFASNLADLAWFLRHKGTKGAADRAFAVHFPWKVGREVWFVTLDRDSEGQKPDEVDHFGSKVIRNVEVDCPSAFFVGQNRGFEDQVVCSS
jgi:hypothetical protein